MKKFGKGVVKCRVLILILSIVLLVPSAIGYFNTRVNYDILSYLPDEIETMKGQEILKDDFGIGAFSLCVVEGMENKDVVALERKIEEVPHVKKVVCMTQLQTCHCRWKYYRRKSTRYSTTMTRIRR